MPGDGRTRGRGSPGAAPGEVARNRAERGITLGASPSASPEGRTDVAAPARQLNALVRPRLLITALDELHLSHDVSGASSLDTTLLVGEEQRKTTTDASNPHHGPGCGEGRLTVRSDENRDEC